MKKYVVAIAMGATALSPFIATRAAAQSAPQKKALQRFDIPSGGLAEALQRWSKATKLQIVYRMDDVGRKQTNGVRGEHSAMMALQALLIGTDLKIVETEDGAIALRPLAGDELDANATPDILVQGKKSWSLNAGIERTQDDSQPFIVMSRKEIEQSGAPNLEAFLRNQLNVNASPVVGDQVSGGNEGNSGAGNRPVGISSINLRGIGLRDTLILIDGRRQPGVNIGSGDITQPSITGIPISAVERIEVLASSASGIYGSGASGGVINIVLRRDFRGGELSLNYGNTTDFAQGRGSIDLVAGVPIENGRTRISLTGNWTKADPLVYGDRENIRQRGITTLEKNNPEQFYGFFAYPPLGSAVNFKTFDGSPLQLKPEYGGQTLSSAVGYIPAGYAGLQKSGIAPLLAGIGKYNLDQPDTASGYGKRAPLLYPVDQYSGSLAVRREFNRWLTAYAEVGMVHSSAVNIFSNSIGVYTISPSAPNNPFTKSIALGTPPDGRFDTHVRNTNSNLRTLGGAIIQLPWEWQAVAELSYSRASYERETTPPAQVNNYLSLLGVGAIDGFRDLVAFPLDVPYNTGPYNNRSSVSHSSNIAPSLRLAGPLPFTLPGGRPRITLNTEINTQTVGEVWATSLTDQGAFTTYTPMVRQTARSAYGEVAFPLLGGEHTLPLIRLLELRFSARHESYKGDGVDPFPCPEPYVTGKYDYFAGCPTADAIIPRSVTRNSRTDPSVSMLWSPVDGVTLRGSYTTGYLPPQLNQLVRLTVPFIALQVNDPLRGNELIGATPFGFGLVPGFGGGNPNVRPETSKTFTGGIILKPHFIDGLRFSIDWTKLQKKDVYFDPSRLLTPFFGGSQEQFELFIQQNPDRVVRGAPSGGYAVGPITSLDVSIVNLKSLSTQAFDFTLNYDTSLFGGTLSTVGRATYVDSLTIASFGDAPAVNYAGSITNAFASIGGGQGALRWRGSGSVQWTRDALSIGWQARYMSGYYLRSDQAVVSAQGSAKVDSQTYHDMNVTYRFPQKMTVRAGINNVFNKMPPLDATQQPLFYSPFGDPRLRNFYLGVTKGF
ncbi:TonB-dependent receptor [Sphingomonas sp. VNH70]|uniref:TonB-dependent receptor n=1 Tax=Sphingomonas silueang TaxID=3156617 RepID=UPI0032B32B65